MRTRSDRSPRSGIFETTNVARGEQSETLPVALDEFALSLRSIVPAGTIGVLTFPMFRRESQGVVIAEGALLVDSSFGLADWMRDWLRDVIETRVLGVSEEMSAWFPGGFVAAVPLQTPVLAVGVAVVALAAYSPRVARLIEDVGADFALQLEERDRRERRSSLARSA